MPLHSRLFRDNRALFACATIDSAHVTPGSSGDHVCLIQRALVMLGEKRISAAEYLQGEYGPTTTAAVLSYKTKRRIINFSYQTKPDDIVGKMTIAALDQEVRVIENIPAKSII